MADLDHKIDELRAAMREGFREVRAEFKNVRSEIKDLRFEVGSVREDVKSEIKEVKSEIKDVRSEINGVRSEVKDVRVELRNVRNQAHAEVVELRADLGGRFVGLERSMTALWVSLTGGMAAFTAALVATNL